VLWNYGCLCLQATIDAEVWSNSPFNPFATASGWGPRPFSPQFFGEVGYLESDIVGTSSQRAAYTGLGAQRFSDDVLTDMSCTMWGRNDNPNRWSLSPSSCWAFDIWTQVP